MSQNHPPAARSNFLVSIICAHDFEVDAVHALFDVDYEDCGKHYGKAGGDLNSYVIGRIRNHDVVLAYQPGPTRTPFAAISVGLRSSFPNIKLAIIVGVCGMDPLNVRPQSQPIMLGDVTISGNMTELPRGWYKSPGRIRVGTIGVWDSELCIIKDDLGIPSFLDKLNRIRTRTRLEDKIVEHTREICSKRGFEGSQYPGSEHDILYNTGYEHKHQDESSGCDICTDGSRHPPEDLVCEFAAKSFCEELGCGDYEFTQKHSRDLKRTHPRVLLEGPACSSDLDLCGLGRELLTEKYDRVVFHYDYPSTWEGGSTLFILSASTYADGHRSKKWQGYAAATAAACLKGFLEMWVLPGSVEDPEGTSPKPSTPNPPSENHQGPTNVSMGNTSARDNAHGSSFGYINANNIYFNR